MAPCLDICQSKSSLVWHAEGASPQVVGALVGEAAEQHGVQAHPAGPDVRRGRIVRVAREHLRCCKQSARLGAAASPLADSWLMTRAGLGRPLLPAVCSLSLAGKERVC